MPFHPTNPDTDHYGHYYSDQLYKNATLSTFRSWQWDFREMDSDCIFASTFALADIIPGTMSEEVGWVNKERLCLREISLGTAQSVELWLLSKRGWNFLQWVADNDAWFEQEMLALLDDGPPAVLKGRLALDDRGGVSFVHRQRCWLELAHHLSLLLGQSEWIWAQLFRADLAEEAKWRSYDTVVGEVCRLGPVGLVVETFPEWSRGLVNRYCFKHATGMMVGEPLGTVLHGTNLMGPFEIG